LIASSAHGAAGLVVVQSVAEEFRSVCEISRET